MTNRQQEIARLVAQGLTNKHIARLLRISESTVKQLLHQVFVKFNIRNRTELAIAMREGHCRGTIITSKVARITGVHGRVTPTAPTVTLRTAA